MEMEVLNPELVSAIAAAHKDLYGPGPGGLAPASGSEPPAPPPTPPEPAASNSRPSGGNSALDPAQVALIAEYGQHGRDKADAVGIFLSGYARHFDRLGVQPSDVRNYLLWEQRVLGSLYNAAREPVCSPSRVQELALRFQ